MKIYNSIITFMIYFYTLLIGDDIVANVSGTVLKDQSNVPLQGANVLFKNDSGEEYGTSTDKNGSFNIDNISDGNYSLKISFIGYEDYKKSIIIEAGRKYKVDAFLSIQPILMAKLEIISEADQSYEELPGAATVLDMQTLKLINPIGTQEMLEYIPGVNGFADDGIGNSRISISIRGLNPRRSSRVLILEDGVPIQPALYVYPNMYYNPPSDRIDEIEVIKGSGTILYGPQTMGGVINYFTRRPRSELGGVIKLTGGENGYSSLFTEIGGWGNEKLKPEVQLLLKKGDGFRQNNSFEQVNSTLKLNFVPSSKKNIYLKANLNYENSNATYTGLTQWSFDNDPTFNPKEHDNFKVFRSAIDFIQSERISSSIQKNTTAFASYFDRRWWRENDIFINADSLGSQTAATDMISLSENYWSFNDLVRVGNGQDNFGILRTFYVLGVEQSYKISHNILGYKANMETGWRLYWERFIDDRQTGFTKDSVTAPDARDGVYFRGTGDDLEILGTSHHYETMALSGFFSESLDIGTLTLRPGVRVEIFEQERIDRLQGSMYQDKNLLVLLPGLGFSKSYRGINIFGGIHRGFTPPSSGALKVLNFGQDLDDSGLDLEAEKSWNKELGIRGRSSILDYEFAGFHNDVENLVAAGRGTVFKNLGKVRMQGLEARTSIILSSLNKLLPNINVSYAFLSTKVVDAKIISNVSGSVGSEISINGKEMPYAPNHTLTVGIEHRPTTKISLRADMRYVSRVYTDFENIETTDKIGVEGPVPEYRVYNASGNFRLNQKLNLFFSGKNITDNVYIGSRLHSNPAAKNKDANISSGILPGPRKQVNIGLEYSF